MLVLRDVFGVGELGRIVADDLGLGKFPKSLPLGESPRAPYRVPAELRGLPKADLLEAIRERPEPFFIRTHRLLEARDPAPALYLVRDGRDALVSHVHIIRDRGVPRLPDRVPPELRQLREAEDRYRDLPYNRQLASLISPGIPGYGNWSRNVRAWRRRRGPTAMLRFEELVSDPVTTVSRGCAALGAPLPEPSGELAPFSYLHDRNPLMFRRGTIGSHRDEMAPRLQERFWRVHGDEMKTMGYPRHREPGEERACADDGSQT